MSSKEIVLSSGAWLPGAVIPIVSTAHEQIRRLKTPILVPDLYYRRIVHRDLPDFKDLEKEWFPFYAGDGFYEQITRPDIVAIGCFWRPRVLNGTEILLGAVMVRFEHCLVAQRYIRSFLGASRGLRQWLRAAAFCSNHEAAFSHVQTIGVVDEARGLGIAGELMRQVSRVAKEQGMNLIGFTLHVIEFNEAAIRCYVSNGYKFMFMVPGYYTIDRKRYDGLYYLKCLLPANITTAPDSKPPPQNKGQKLVQVKKNDGARVSYEILSETARTESESTLIVKDGETGARYRAKVLPLACAPLVLIRNLESLVGLERHEGLIKYIGCFMDENSRNRFVILTESVEGTA